MRTATLAELKSRAGKMLKGGRSILVTLRGKPIAVVSPLPDPAAHLSIEVRRKLFRRAVAKTTRKLDAKGITEKQLQRDIKALRKNRRRH